MSVAVSIVVGALVGMGSASASKWVALLVLFGILSAVMVTKPVWAIVLLVISTLSVGWLTMLVGDLPSSSSWIQEVLLACLLASTLLHVARRGHWRSSPVDKWLLLFALVGGLGFIVQLSSPIVAVLGLRNYGKFVILFIALVQLDLPARTLKRVVIVFVCMGAVQVPVALAQRVIYRGPSGDPIGGTLGPNSSGTLTILLLGTATILVGWYLYSERTSLASLIAAGILLVPTALNETKMTFFVAPILFAYVLWGNMHGRLARVFLATILAGALLAGAYQTYDTLYAPRPGRAAVLSRDYLSFYLSRGTTKQGTLERLPLAGFALREIATTPASLVFGFGLGAASDSAFGTSGQGPIFRRYASLGVDSTFLSRFTLESGVLGWAALAGLLVSSVRIARRVRRSRSSRFWWGVALGLEGWVLLMIGLAFYSSTLTIDSLALGFWLLAGVVVAVSVSPPGFEEGAMPTATARHADESIDPSPPSPGPTGNAAARRQALLL